MHRFSKSKIIFQKRHSPSYVNVCYLRWSNIVDVYGLKGDNLINSVITVRQADCLSLPAFKHVYRRYDMHCGRALWKNYALSMNYFFKVRNFSICVVTMHSPRVFSNSIIDMKIEHNWAYLMRFRRIWKWK